MTTFHDLNVPAHLVQALERINITVPTPIQAQSIPIGLEGRDVLASAQTGTGKTISFLIPLITKLSEDKTSTALILTPTRELATQVRDSITQLLGRKNEFGLALIIGGEAISKQFMQLRARPRLVIGTPGRVIDHLHRRTLNLSNTGFLVLDETDRMLDMGFHEQLQELCQFLPDERQTFMFSATMPDNIIKLAQQYLKEPKRVSIGSSNKPIEKIKQDIMHTTNAEKFSLLLKELDAREGSIIVFVKTKRSADELVLKLQHQNHSAEAIHGDLRQHKRDRVIREFRNKKNRIMVATDIAARGLDVPHIEHVVNYDLPQCPEDYIHRIGRTGRAGAVGSAISLISPQDGRLWKMIHNLISPGTPCELPKGYNLAGPDRGGRRRSGGNGGVRAGSRPSFGREGRPSRDRSDRPRSENFSDRAPSRDRGDRPRSENFSERPPRNRAPREDGSPDNRSFNRAEEGSSFRRQKSSADRNYGPRKDGFNSRGPSFRDREERTNSSEFSRRSPARGGRDDKRSDDLEFVPRRRFSDDREDRPQTSSFSARGPAARDRKDTTRSNGFSAKSSSRDARGKPGARAGGTFKKTTGGNAPAFSRGAKKPASKRV